jgi:hypothetical protein
MIARLASHSRWANCDDPTAATAPARSAFEARFLTAADPDGAIRAQIAAAGAETALGLRLTAQLNRRAEHLRKAHFTRLALASAQARARKKKP